LAESYSISEDGKTYTFVLKEGAVWHDGNPVRVRDVIATFAMIQNPEYKSPLSVSFQKIQVTEVDEKTVAFLLPEPFAPFLSTLTVGILPAHIWDSIAPSSAFLADVNVKPVGSGPFRFVKFSKDSYGSIHNYTLSRFEGYYGEKPHISTIIFSFFEDLESAKAALMRQQIDGIGALQRPFSLEEFQGKNLNVYQPAIAELPVLFFNTKKPIVEDARVRQALRFVTDTAILRTSLAHTTTLLPPPLPFPELTKNQEEAEKILADLAWEERTLTITTSHDTWLLQIAEEVAKQWGDLDIAVRIDAVSPERITKERLRDRSFEILLLPLRQGIEDDLYGFWHSSQIPAPGLNVSQYKNTALDTLIEEARESAEAEKREALVRQAYQMIFESVPAIFLGQSTYPFAISARVKGVEPEDLIIPSDRFQSVERWYIKTKRTFYTRQKK
jgi:peptide/nickel transport system substrate-binding protein